MNRKEFKENLDMLQNICDCICANCSKCTHQMTCQLIDEDLWDVSIEDPRYWTTIDKTKIADYYFPNSVDRLFLEE